MGDIVEFKTVVGHQMVFYEITGSAINFEVKAPGNAGIGLAKKVGPECNYMIALGNDHQSWIKKVHNEGIITAETPNILSRQEFRRFWVSWNGNIISVGGDGHSNPIVSCRCKTSELKYVTFFVVSPHNAHVVHWKIQLPPLLQKAIIKPIVSRELRWMPIQGSPPGPGQQNPRVLPDGALIGGYEKENLYIIRAKHRGSVTPGKFVPTECSAYISWGGDSHLKPTYEVLCGFDCIWVPTSKDKIPVGAFVGGHSETIAHEKLYIGRVKYCGHIIPGKVQPSHRTCYFAYEGKEVGSENYEILVVPEEKRCANTIMVPYIESNEYIDMENEDEEVNPVEYFSDEG